MNYFKFVACGLFLILPPLVSWSQTDHRKCDRTGIIKGSIFDPSFSVIVIPPPKIVLEGKERYVADVSATGSYEICLPEDTYRVYVAINGFYPISRTGLQVRALEEYLLNFQAFPVYVSRGTSISKINSVDVKAVKHRIGPLFSRQIIANDPFPLIQFLRKTPTKSGFRYDNVIITYGFWTVYADTVLFDASRKAYSIEGETIRIENGTKSFFAKRLRIASKSGRVTFDYE